MNKPITEETPVTTTNNAGAGLTSPQLPIKPTKKKNILSRFMDMKKKQQ